MIPTAGTGRKLNVYKTFVRRSGRLLNVLCEFNLRPVSTGAACISFDSLSNSAFNDIFCF